MSFDICPIAIPIDRDVKHRSLDLFLFVGFLIKVAEQINEDYRVGYKEIRESLWYFAVHRENHQLVAEYYEELHLTFGE